MRTEKKEAVAIALSKWVWGLTLLEGGEPRYIKTDDSKEDHQEWGTDGRGMKKGNRKKRRGFITTVKFYRHRRPIRRGVEKTCETRPRAEKNSIISVRGGREDQEKGGSLNGPSRLGSKDERRSKKPRGSRKPSTTGGGGERTCHPGPPQDFPR